MVPVWTATTVWPAFGRPPLVVSVTFTARVASETFALRATHLLDGEMVVFNEDGMPDIAVARSDAPDILYFGNIKSKR